VTQYSRRATDQWSKESRMSPAEQVIFIVADRLGLSVQEINVDASFEQDLNADSLDAMEILHAINSHFKLRLQPSDMEAVHKVSDLIKLVEEHCQ